MNANEYPTTRMLGDVIDRTSLLVDPVDFSYFTTLSESQWNQAKATAKKEAVALAGTPFESYSRNHGPVERAGEIAFKSYLDYYCHLPYDADCVTVDPYSTTFAISGSRIGIHTRMLRKNPSEPNRAPMLHIRKFQFTIPEIGLTRRADIFIFCGYNVADRAAYVFGWTTSAKVAALPLDTNLPYPAKCLPIIKAHPIHTLLPYLSE